MTIFLFLILSLATWRISALFTRETGPLHIFERLRKKVGIVHDADGKVMIIPSHFLPELLSCVWCFSIWAAAVLVILTACFVHLEFLMGFLLVFALSSVAIFLDRLI